MNGINLDLVFPAPDDMPKETQPPQPTTEQYLAWSSWILEQMSKSGQLAAELRRRQCPAGEAFRLSGDES
ncbi:MAG: hypothetical protein M3463_03960 [Verrucomicrobiota bacterium]|nr:hypothetical protein [Verrucomicrobiota bacterium]